MQNSTKISRHLKDQNTLTSSALDSLAKTSQSLAKEKEYKVNDLDYGVKPGELLAKLDPASSSWKTPQCSLFEDSEQSLQIWPKSGMTRNGNAYTQKHLDCNMVGKEFILLPTPVKSSYGSAMKRFFKSQFYKGNLQEYVRDGVNDPIYLNPEVSEVLLNFPISWTEI